MWEKNWKSISSHEHSKVGLSQEWEVSFTLENQLI